jgi:hypothetical protein
VAFPEVASAAVLKVRRTGDPFGEVLHELAHRGKSLAHVVNLALLRQPRLDPVFLLGLVHVGARVETVPAFGDFHLKPRAAASCQEQSGSKLPHSIFAHRRKRQHPHREDFAQLLHPRDDPAAPMVEASPGDLVKAAQERPPYTSRHDVVVAG